MTLSAIRSSPSRLPLYVAVQALVALACVFVLRLDLPRPPPAYRATVAEVNEGGVWRPVAFPIDRKARSEDPPPVDYRIPFSLPGSAPEETWSVLIPRFSTGVQLFINGTLIEDTLRDPATSRPDRNVPVISLIPPALLIPGPNVLTVKLFVWGPVTGYVDSVYLGPDSRLRPSFDRRIALFETFPLLLISLQATLSLVFALIWLSRRQDAIYGLLAAAMGIGVVQNFIAMPAALPLHGFIAASVSIEGALMVMFTMRLVGLRSRPALWLVLAPGMLLLLMGLSGSRALLQRGYLLLGPTSVTLSVLAVSALLGWSAVRRRDQSSFLLGSVFTAVIVASLHDLLTVMDLVPGERLFVGRLSYSLVLVTIGLGLTWRFVHALNEADGFASKLVRQVREAEEKLRQSFVREEERARSEALTAERTRLMRDLHDGLGGQLVSIVALAEQGQDRGAIGEAARAALKDLRLVIDAMEDIDGDLMLVLGSWRERISAQLRAHAISLRWEVLSPGGLPAISGLRPGHVIQIIRLLDEAVTNAIKHSGGRTISVSLDSLDDAEGRACGRITVSDDGCGFGEDDGGPVRRPGRGLANMKKRAELCGASLSLISDAAGTSVVLTLPAVLPDAP